MANATIRPLVKRERKFRKLFYCLELLREDCCVCMLQGFRVR